MKRFVIAPILILALASMSFSPIVAHKTSGSDCGDLFNKIGSAAWELAQKAWTFAQAWLRKQNAEGFIEKAKAEVAYLRAGHAVKSAAKKLEDAWDHFREHCGG